MALQNLSSLTVLELEDTVTEVLHEIHQLGALENNDLSKFSLSNISICALADTPSWNWEKFLKSTVFLCPSISQVYLCGDFEFLDDSILLELLPLDKLERLSVKGLINADCLLPFLKERGRSLKHLHIAVVHEDYIPLIAQYCPNLRSLSLINVRFEVESDLGIVHDVNVSPQVRRQGDKPMLKQPIFKYLEKLKLFNLHEMLRESICLLLLSPSLKYVDISDCAVFTDDVLKRATNAHSFPNLVSFEMANCELATHKILDILLQDSVSDDLNSIKLQWWEQKEPSNFDQIVDNWRKIKEKKRWDLKIWLCYEFQHVCQHVYNKKSYFNKGPFEYSSDEETDEDEDEIIKNKIIII